jgi:hypothetical protein
MTNSILLQNVSPEQFTELMTMAFKSQLDDFKESIKNQTPDELLTQNQTCEFLQIDNSTLWRWTNKNKVIAYGIGGRRYYKRSELLECLTPLKK